MRGHAAGACYRRAGILRTVWIQTALSQVLQNMALKQQLLNCIPYISTILALVIFNYANNRKKQK